MLGDSCRGMKQQTVVVDGGMAVNYFDRDIIAGTISSS